MAAEDGDKANRHASRPACFLDARRRVRSLLRARWGNPVTALYDETGVQQEVVYGLLPISGIRCRMLCAPNFRPEIVCATHADGLGDSPKELDEPPEPNPATTGPAPHWTSPETPTTATRSSRTRARGYSI